MAQVQTRPLHLGELLRPRGRHPLLLLQPGRAEAAVRGSRVLGEAESGGQEAAGQQGQEAQDVQSLDTGKVSEA